MSNLYNEMSAKAVNKTKWERFEILHVPARDSKRNFCTKEPKRFIAFSDGKYVTYEYNIIALKRALRNKQKEGAATDSLVTKFNEREVAK